MHYPPHLNKLIQTLRKLPGVGQKSAERYAFHLIQRPAHELNTIADTIAQTPDQLLLCDNCGCLKDPQHCGFCEDPARTGSTLCLIGSPRDAFSIDDTNEYRGFYHVIPSSLSPLDGRSCEDIDIPKLMERIELLEINEVIIALDSTLEGDATALYIKQQLEHLPLTISRLAFGIPLGSSLDFVDQGSLTRAISSRNCF